MKKKEIVLPLTNWQKIHRLLPIKEGVQKIEDVVAVSGYSSRSIYRLMKNPKLRQPIKIAIAKIYKVELNEIFPPQTKAL